MKSDQTPPASTDIKLLTSKEMGSGITRFEQQQSLVCQSLATKKQQGLKRFLSEPALPTIRENCEEETPLEGNQQMINLAKVIFPHMHSSPDLLQTAVMEANLSNPIIVKKASSKILMSPPISELTFQVGERNYILEKTNSRKRSWKEIELAALISKPFTGNVRTFPPKKCKLKNIRTVAVTTTHKP